MTSDWWTCKGKRKRTNAALQKHAAAQIAEINRAYKAAKIPGATPQHWLGKISRMKNLGRPMPKGLEHLAESLIDDDDRNFIESGKKAARDYFATEYAGIRAQNFKRAQKKYATTNAAKLSQSSGGSKSGVSRRLQRDKNAVAIVDAYKKATATAADVKPVARLVAGWHKKNSPTQSLRAIVQMLQRAGVAT